MKDERHKFEKDTPLSTMCIIRHNATSFFDFSFGNILFDFATES